MAHRAQPVRNQEGRFGCHDVVESVLHDLLALAVESAGSLIQEKDLGVADDGARNRNTLLLPPRELRTPLSYLGVILVGKVHHKGVRVSRFGSSLDPFLGERRVAECDVLCNGPVKQDRLLAHQCDLAAQPLDVERSNVLAVQKDTPRIRVVPPLQKGYAGAFSRARGSHKGDLLTRLDLNRDAPEDGCVGPRWVRKLHVAKLYEALRLTARLVAVGACWVDLRDGVYKLKGVRHCLLAFGDIRSKGRDLPHSHGGEDEDEESLQNVTAFHDAILNPKGSNRESHEIRQKHREMSKREAEPPNQPLPLSILGHCNEALCKKLLHLLLHTEARNRPRSRNSLRGDASCLGKVLLCLPTLADHRIDLHLGPQPHDRHDGKDHER
mmetsp:Transcript_11838/g.29656  ORF Transcript_11838/g.29656 Transcript_11838/m.29656 type:complete len:382 (-) Transcript_11838:1758-2903(-)